MDLDERGLATRRAVLGDACVDHALAKTTPFTAPLQEPVTRHPWGNPWQRQGIDLRTRSIANVAMPVALTVSLLAGTTTVDGSTTMLPATPPVRRTL